MCFSQDEMDLLNDPGFLLTKRAIQEKILQKLDETRSIIVKSEPTIINRNIWPTLEGKISRGENYRSLPYYVLDCPAMFKKESILAIRTMIWWGHEISCTLHIQGNALSVYLPKVLKNLKSLDNDLFIGINHSPWEYHFEKDNYVRKGERSISYWGKFLEEHHFIKISRTYPIEKIADMEKLIHKNVLYFSQILT